MALLRLILLLGALVLAAGCPRIGLQPVAGRVAVPAGLSIGAGAAAAHRGATTLLGRVESTRFKVQANFGDVATNATVALIDPLTGDTLATALTDGAGTFAMQFPSSFNPDPDKVAYVVEAIKGGKIQGGYNFAGAPAVRLRTLIQWNKDGLYWYSLTGIASGDAVVVNRSTTAIAVGVGLRQAAVDPTKFGSEAQTRAQRELYNAGLMGSVAVGTPDAAVQPTTPDTYTKSTQTSLTVGEFHAVFGLVDQALLNGQDPVHAIAWINQPSLSPPQFALVPPGFTFGGFSASKVKAGQTIKLTGGGFPLDVSQIAVVFTGGAEATSMAVNPTGTELTLTVPVGARSGPVTLRLTLPGNPVPLTLLAGSLTVPATDGHAVIDAIGNLWLAGKANDTLWTLSPAGVWTRKASEIALAGPRGVALKIDGQNKATAYITSWNSGTIFRLADGQTTPVPLSLGSTNKLRNPWGIAVEASGSYLVASFGGSELRRIFDNGSSAGIASVSQPVGVAIDPGGNVFVSSWDRGEVVRMATSGGAVSVPVLTGLARPAGLAFLPDGTLAVACYGSDQIVRMAPDGSLLGPILPRGTHQGIIDVAADDLGRLYVGALDSHTLARVEPDGRIVDIALAPRNVWGLARFDASGDIAVGIINDLWPYSARPRDSRVYIAAYSGGSYQPFVAIDGFGNPEAVAYDGAGNLYVADGGAGNLIKISGPPAGPRKTLISGIGRTAQLAVDSAGKVHLAALDGPLSVWDPAQPAKLTRFAPGRTFYAVGRDDVNGGPTYLAGPRDGQIFEVTNELTPQPTLRHLATVPGVAGLTFANAKLYALVGQSGDVVLVNTSTGAATTLFSAATASVDIAGIGTNLYVATANGAIVRIEAGTGARAAIYQLAGDTIVRLHARATGDLHLTARKQLTVVRLTNLEGAIGETVVASFSAFAGLALTSEIGTDSLNSLTGLTFDGGGNLYVAQSVAGAARIFQLPASGFGQDQTGAAPWLSLDAPVMGMANIFLGGNNTLVTANPQDGAPRTTGALDAAPGHAIKTGDRSVTALGTSLGRLLGVALAQGTFYLLSSPAIPSTAISQVTNASWKRHGRTAPCCGANHPYVDSGGNLYVPNTSGAVAVRQVTAAGFEQDFSGPSFGAMSGVIAEFGKSGSFVGGSLGGGAGNAPLLRFTTPGQAARPMDNWPYEPSF